MQSLKKIGQGGFWIIGQYLEEKKLSIAAVIQLINQTGRRCQISICNQTKDDLKHIFYHFVFYSSKTKHNDTEI